jgi:hypothetical protein
VEVPYALVYRSIVEENRPVVLTFEVLYTPMKALGTLIE